MRNLMLILIPVSFVALLLFAYSRNRQARRNDERRERLWEKQEEVMEMLRNKEDTGSDIK